jgi:hypothetical protein
MAGSRRQYLAADVLGIYINVISSMHRKAQLSTQTGDWIEGWSGLITDNKSALVALFDQPGIRRGTVASTLEYLRKVADRKGISFYTHTIFDLSRMAIGEALEEFGPLSPFQG